MSVRIEDIDDYDTVFHNILREARTHRAIDKWVQRRTRARVVFRRLARHAHLRVHAR